MNIAVFVTIWSAGMSSVDLNTHFLDAPLDYLKAENAVHTVEIYTPEPGDVPKMDDVPAPSIIIQIDMNDEDAAVALTQSEKFKQIFLDKNSYDPTAEKINLEITEAVHFPLPGLETPPARTAALSFVVRYYGPVKDEAKFVEMYTSGHPQILAKFEGIRNVLCYLPLNWRSTGEVLDEKMIIGNEVVFDDLAALNLAIQSEVAPEAQGHSKHFQKYGYNTHHAMHRELIFSRQD
jgi:hypothetical protein